MPTEISDIDVLTERIRLYVLAAVNAERYAHSLRTAQTCVKFCKVFGIDEKKGYLAGIAHDMCKDMGDALLLSLAAHDGKPVSSIEKEKPSLLHGRAAAVKLRDSFGVIDEDVLEAVANHTFGRKGMCDLAKILFAADKVEPGRASSGNDYIKKLLKLPLKEILKKIVEENIKFLNKKGKIVAAETLELYESLQ